MATTTPSKTVTYEEWLTMPEVSDEIEEVVGGQIVRMPPAKWKYTCIVESLSDTLKAQVDPAQVQVITSQFGLVIGKRPLRVRVPDLAVFFKDSVVERDGYIHSAPALIVEALSRANRLPERESKLRDYQDLGVPEVWVLSPEARTFEILQLQDGKLRAVSILREGQIRPLKFPDVVVDTATVWPD
jgi:Uma2 family endonuclease